MKEHKEIILDFMVALASNPNIKQFVTPQLLDTYHEASQDEDPIYVTRSIALEMAHAYITCIMGEEE